MKIILVSMDFPPTVGGIAAHVYELSIALRDLGHRIVIFTRAIDGVHYPQIENIQIIEIKLKFINLVYGLQIRSAIKKHMDQIQPDIIHIHGMGPLEWYDIHTVPMVYTNHTSGYLKRIQKGGIRRMALLRRLFKKPRLFLAPSKELLEIPFPIEAKKEFIPNGINSNKYIFSEDDRQRIREDLGFKENDLVGLLTRRLVEKNGVRYLAEATKHITNERCNFIIIGDGEERERVERTLSHHFAGRYRVLGEKKHDEIIPYYSAADFSVLPSLMEATSISGLEAMSSSLPLVGTHIGGIPELIVDGTNGFLCEPANSLDLAKKIDLLLTKNLKELGTNSRKMVEHKFDWRQIADQTVQAYKGIV